MDAIISTWKISIPESAYPMTTIPCFSPVLLALPGLSTHLHWEAVIHSISTSFFHQILFAPCRLMMSGLSISAIDLQPRTRSSAIKAASGNATGQRILLMTTCLSSSVSLLRRGSGCGMGAALCGIALTPAAVSLRLSGTFSAESVQG